MKIMKTAARVTIYEAPKMSRQGRLSVARWLMRQAKLLLRKNDKLASRFTARYNYD